MQMFPPFFVDAGGYTAKRVMKKQAVPFWAVPVGGGGAFCRIEFEKGKGPWAMAAEPPVS